MRGGLFLSEQTPLLPRLSGFQVSIEAETYEKFMT